MNHIVNLSNSANPLHICAKYIVHQERKKDITFFWKLNGSYLFKVEPPSPFTQGCFLGKFDLN